MKARTQKIFLEGKKMKKEYIQLNIYKFMRKGVCYEI